jgi:hypothetical protein
VESMGVESMVAMLRTPKCVFNMLNTYSQSCPMLGEAAGAVKSPVQ